MGNCQVGVFLGYASERGHALVDKALYLPKEWTGDPGRCKAAGVPEEEITYQSKAELGLNLLRQARQAGHLQGQWVTADEAYGEVPTFRDALDREGWRYVLEVPCDTSVFDRPVCTEVPVWRGRGRHPTRERLVAGEPGPVSVATLASQLRADEWQTLTVMEGAQGPRRYQFAARRVWESRDGLPGRACWLIWRRNLDGSDLKYYLSNAPEDTLLLPLAQVGARRWSIETEFETEKGETGLDEYEVRSWQSWHHHITMALLAGVFLLKLQQEWGEKDAPYHPAATDPRAASTPPAAPMDAG